MAGVIPTPSFSTDPGHHLHLLPDEGHPQWLRGHVAPPPKGHCAKPTHAQPLLLPPGVGGLQVGRGGDGGCCSSWSKAPSVPIVTASGAPPPPSVCRKGLGDWEIKEKAWLELCA